MRRALIGIVPDEVLNRKRKAYASRGAIVATVTGRAQYAEMSRHMISTLLGIVDDTLLREALQQVGQDEQVPMVALIRTFAIESWLRCMTDKGVLDGFTPFSARPTAQQAPRRGLLLKAQLASCIGKPQERR